MTAQKLVFAPLRTLEDPLAYLPHAEVKVYRKGKAVYEEGQLADRLYLVVSGKIKVSRTTSCGRGIVMDVYRTDEFFGEDSLLGSPLRIDRAVAMERTEIMEWTADRIEELVSQRTQLAMALLQLMVQRTIQNGYRIESFSVDGIARRLARALIDLSGRMGELQADGYYRLTPFTHQTLGQYVGTSREIVTHFMNGFRKKGYLRYSREGIVLNRAALGQWLEDSKRL